MMAMPFLSPDEARQWLAGSPSGQNIYTKLMLRPSQSSRHGNGRGDLGP